MDAHRRDDLVFESNGSLPTGPIWTWDSGSMRPLMMSKGFRFSGIDGLSRSIHGIVSSLRRSPPSGPLLQENIGRREAVAMPGRRGRCAPRRTLEEYRRRKRGSRPSPVSASAGRIGARRFLANSRRLHTPSFGAGSVVELMDAVRRGERPAGMATGRCAVVFTSEHSDKTRGSVAEMRRATEMVALMTGRPYPKDLGLDLLILKEKRRRREPPLAYESIVDAHPAPDEIVYDPLGCIRIGIEDDWIVAVHRGRAVREDPGKTSFIRFSQTGVSPGSTTPHTSAKNSSRRNSPSGIREVLSRTGHSERSVLVDRHAHGGRLPSGTSLLTNYNNIYIFIILFLMPVAAASSA